jgi:hypothetical protein
MMPSMDSDAAAPVETGAPDATNPLVEAAAKALRGRTKPRAKLVADAPRTSAKKPISRILQLVAALKAEQEAPAPERKVAPASAPVAAPVEEPSEPISVLSSLRDILVSREQERSEWEERARSLEGELVEARAALRAAREAAVQSETQHRRIVADLKLLHEHQRSIWQLEHRRLEITLDGFEKKRQKKIVKRAAYLARPALVAGLLIVLVALAVLSGDSGAAHGNTNPGTHSLLSPAR